MLRRVLLAAAAVAFSTTAAFAGPPAVIGADSAIGAWDGVGTAMTGPSSGLYSLTVSLGSASNFKVYKDQALGWTAGNDIGDTGAGNLSTQLNAAGSTTFYYRPANSVGEPATHSVSTAKTASMVWVAVGGFQSKAGGSDWDPDSAATQLGDAGTNGDLVAADGIFSRKFTMTGSGSSENWKVVGNNVGVSWPGELKLGPNGWSQDPGDSANQTVPTYSTGDVLYFEFNSIAGTLRVALQPAEVTDWTLLN